MPMRTSKNSLLRILIGLPTPLIVFNAHVAFAQTNPSAMAAVPQLASYCKSSSLSGPEFMRSLHEIVSHGDLDDVGFITKILGTKFIGLGSTTLGGILPSQITNYRTDEVLDNPIQVRLTLYQYPTQPNGHNQIAFMRIESLPMPTSDFDFISACLHISPKDFSSYFAGDFSFDAIDPAPSANDANNTQGNPVYPYSDMIQAQGSPGRNGSKIYLGFTSNENQLITEITIHQNE